MSNSAKWTGDTVTGPKTVTVSQPVERIPLWHKAGGLTILASEPTLRVDDQDWSELTLEAFPHDSPSDVTTRTFVDRGAAEAQTTVEMRTDMDAAEVHFAITAAEDNAERAWVLRIHLAPGQRVSHAEAVLGSDDGQDGAELETETATVRHLSAVSESDAADFMPFGGKGTRPAVGAGPIAELVLSSSAKPRTVRVRLK